MLTALMITKAKSSKKKGKATQISEKIAERLLGLRTNLGLTQRGMAEKIHVTFQQYQKYEKAKDRLSLERAIVLCENLGIPLAFFNVGSGNDALSGFAETAQASFGKDNDMNFSVEEANLLKIFHDIPKKSRKAFLEAARESAKSLAGKN